MVGTLNLIEISKKLKSIKSICVITTDKVYEDAIDKKSYKENVDELTAKNVGLKDEFKNLEKKYKKVKEEQANMRDQLKLYQSK